MKREYRPSEIELAHYRRWEQAGFFRPSGSGAPYCIVIPPPNVTGTLHMGHAFQDTIMDALTRYHRMRGRNTLWQPGTDHAGIATEMVVTRLLAAEGIAKRELGRERFVERVWQWKHRSGGTIAEQLRRLGCSVDWSRDRFTMDPGLSAAVAKVFVDLYDEGLIYRGKRLVNWDPVLQTVISDLEVLSTEERGKLWRFRYPLEEGGGHLVVATTRPETMLGDTAVAVHPQDARYRHLVGKRVRLPLAGRSIPIIADDYVDPEFGTGCVKITPGHDFNDYEVGQRHSLPVLNVFDPSARLNDAAPPAYRGLDRFEARERVLRDLEAQGFLDGVDEHVLKVPRAERSGTVVEPYLTDQWYVRMQPLAAAAVEAVEAGRVRFVPENWAKVYFDWMRNIQDWCISRQLWWGHRVPAWYGPNGEIYVAPTEQDARAKHSLDASVPLVQDTDVFDTWFSSALWPFSTMGWPERTPELETFYPTSVLVTGFDIIFFWVARMIMMGLKFAGDVPFRDVYIHGLIRDQDGQKMSKSKGNILDPLDLVNGVDLETLVAKRTEGLMQPSLKPRIEQATRKEFPDGIRPYGADALRLTFAALATTGQDLRFDFGRIDGNHRFCNKLWNATSYVLGQLEGTTPSAELELDATDRWIRSRLGRTVRTVHEQLAAYRLDLVQQALYDFTWHELCDWYLELTKPTLTDAQASPARLAATRATLAETLGSVLKLWHPLIPFVTEELWLALCAKTGVASDTIMLERLPEPEDFPLDEPAEAEIAWLQGLIVGIRQIRGEMGIARSVALPVKLAGATPLDAARAARHAASLRKLANVESIEVIAEGVAVPGAATALLGELRILVPLAGLVDVSAERERLGKHLDRLRAELDKSRRKLANADFAANAPVDVVAKERARAEDCASRAARLAEQLARLAELE